MYTLTEHVGLDSYYEVDRTGDVSESFRRIRTILV